MAFFQYLDIALKKSAVVANPIHEHGIEVWAEDYPALFPQPPRRSPCPPDVQDAPEDCPGAVRPRDVDDFLFRHGSSHNGLRLELQLPVILMV